VKERTRAKKCTAVATQAHAANLQTCSYEGLRENWSALGPDPPIAGRFGAWLRLGRQTGTLHFDWSTHASAEQRSGYTRISDYSGTVLNKGLATRSVPPTRPTPPRRMMSRTRRNMRRRWSTRSSKRIGDVVGKSGARLGRVGLATYNSRAPALVIKATPQVRRGEGRRRGGRGGGRRRRVDLSWAARASPRVDVRITRLTSPHSVSGSLGGPFSTLLFQCRSRSRAALKP